MQSIDRVVNVTRTALIVALCGTCAIAQDGWSNSGGNAGRNGQTAAIGPADATVLWNGGPSSIIAWQPVIEGDRVFAVRQTGFPPEPASDESPVMAFNLETGAQLWRRDLPWLTGDWTTWVAGVNNGKVYASRAGNGASVKAVLYALDAATGAILWQSAEKIDAGAYDGVVFAPNGDPVVASFTRIWRISAVDGSTVWSVSRVGSVSGNCGGAIHNGAIYVADAIVGGHAIKKFDLATGAFLYQSPQMPGFTIQNTPMVSPDGTIYLSRVQNNTAVDYFYAINDDGSSMSIRWSAPAEWSTRSEFAVAPDGDVYMFAPGKFLQKRRASDGVVVAQFEEAITADSFGPRMAVDANGTLFVSNGAFSDGNIKAMPSDLSSVLWSANVTNINIGGPAIADDGTLVVAGNGTQLRAYKSAGCPADFDGSGFVDTDDFDAFVAAFEAGTDDADFDGSGFVDTDDFDAFVGAFEGGC
jgi:outer membrane protein assembly factor BamB